MLVSKRVRSPVACCPSRYCSVRICLSHIPIQTGVIRIGNSKECRDVPGESDDVGARWLAFHCVSTGKQVIERDEL